MRNLWLFLQRIKHILLFLFLEVLSLLMLYENSLYQRTLLFNSFVAIEGQISYLRESIVGYFYLKQENEQLKKENAYLRSLLKTSYLISYQASFQKNDTLYRQRFRFVPATVIRSTTQYKDNYITIDKGTNQGVAKGQGVFSPTGIVGVVEEVTPNYALVRSFLNSRFFVSAQIKGKPSVGTASWSGKHYSYGILQDIPLHVKPLVGDSVITSPYSDIFPAGLLIGTIEKIDIDESNSFYLLEFKLAVDFGNLSIVYVVTDLLKEEINQLHKFTNISQ
ncbi:MAG: rod shape-determining protein MreC [Bacteroidales bacterium]|nr:rod shape-determining protein MreC [Bacteroidales bacterium]